MRSSALATVTTTIVVLLAATPGAAQQFIDGLAQPVFDVSGSNLVTQQVWVEIRRAWDRQFIPERFFSRNF